MATTQVGIEAVISIRGEVIWASDFGKRYWWNLFFEACITGVLYRVSGVGVLFSGLFSGLFGAGTETDHIDTPLFCASETDAGLG